MGVLDPLSDPSTMGILALAGGYLANAGPSRTPVSTSSALGHGFQGMQEAIMKARQIQMLEAYRKAQEAHMTQQNSLLSEQVNLAKDKQRRQGMLDNLLLGGQPAAGGQTTPQAGGVMNNPDLLETYGLLSDKPGFSTLAQRKREDQRKMQSLNEMKSGQGKQGFFEPFMNDPYVGQYAKSLQQAVDSGQLQDVGQIQQRWNSILQLAEGARKAQDTRAATDANQEQNRALRESLAQQGFGLRQQGLDIQRMTQEQNQERSNQDRAVKFSNTMQQYGIPGMVNSIDQVNAVLNQYKNPDEVPGIGSLKNLPMANLFLSDQGKDVKSTMQGAANNILRTMSGLAVTIPEQQRRDLEQMRDWKFSGPDALRAWGRTVGWINSQIGNLTSGAGPKTLERYSSQPGAVPLNARPIPTPAQSALGAASSPQPPGTPSEQLPSVPTGTPQRTVTRRGKYKGKSVIQYSDGTVEYE